MHDPSICAARWSPAHPGWQSPGHRVLRTTAVPSLRGRMRLLVVGLTATFRLTALVAVSRLRILKTSVTDVLSHNYRSIEAAGGMARAVMRLQLAAHDGRAADAGPDLRA